MTEWFAPVSAQEYLLDAWQRWVLCLDVLRARGNIYLEHSAQKVPHVLDFEAELVIDGRTLPRPVNYALARMNPLAGTPRDPTARPVIVVDPRAGHGPGIGGMKKESEIGVALAAGYPCYFIGFLPEPVPGQTVEDVCRAEAAFVEAVASRHPEADGKPAIIGNCQAGWQIMMMAATNPDLTGPILLAGSPLSYWAGVRGKNPLRYLGGILGGTWLTAMAGDAGNGIFDGANLVANFESLNLANTYWQKAYNVYSRVDSEAERFLEFETWWGSPVLLNAGEMQWIADNLFVGNKLAAGELRTSDGVRIDLRNIKSPIIVFCSWGDNITPPQQALGWITDLYEHEQEIVANGQTIVYTLHQTIGHLGIFVSGKVASKEHDKFTNCLDMIDLMPPGLYEAVITEVTPDLSNPQLIHGKYLLRLEARTLDDIRALGGNSEEDDLRFATAARVSEINLGLYQKALSSLVKTMSQPPVAEAFRAAHPNRARFEFFSDRNPFMQQIKPLADAVRADRKPVSADNPWLALEHAVSDGIANWLDACGAWRDMLTESFFLNTYGSPLLQAAVGLGTQQPEINHTIARDVIRDAAAAKMRAELEHDLESGGVPEALLRALIYIRLSEESADERGFAAIKALRASQPAAKRLIMSRLKEVARKQFLLVRMDPERAIIALPKLLPKSESERRAAFDALQKIISAPGPLSEEGARRMARVKELFDLKAPAQARGEPISA